MPVFPLLAQATTTWPDVALYAIGAVTFVVALVIVLWPSR